MTDPTLVRGRWLVTGGEGQDPVLHDAALAISGDTIDEIGDWPAPSESVGAGVP
jgi:hypothetical protein